MHGDFGSRSIFQEITHSTCFETADDMVVVAKDGDHHAQRFRLVGADPADELASVSIWQTKINQVNLCRLALGELYGFFN